MILVLENGPYIEHSFMKVSSANTILTDFVRSTEPVMPMIPLGLKETKEIDFSESFKVRRLSTMTRVHRRGDLSPDKFNSIWVILNEFSFRRTSS